MKPRFLLINPWIYDFAAVNLWSRPLGLLKVAEYLSQFDVDMALIDCTDVFDKYKWFGTGKYPRHIVKKPDVLKHFPRNFACYGMSVEQFTETVNNSLPFDAVFITSIMTYWYPGVQQAIEIVKSLSPGKPVILGGIYATLCHDHAAEHSGADFIIRGRIQDTANFDDICMACGFSLCRKHRQKPYYKLNLYRQYHFAPVLTGEGCPNRCSYCASYILSKTFTQSPPVHAVKEIKELYRMGITDFAFYDDALLVNADQHLKIILKEIIKSEMKIRLHSPNGLHARFIDDDLALLMKQAGFQTIRLSLETVDRKRQEKTGGKVTTDMLESAVKILKKQGFKKEHIGVYLMFGLPEQELEEVKEGIELLKKLDVKIHLTEFSPIPGTESWDELLSKGIIHNDMDPLLTNNTVFSYLLSGYNQDDIEQLKNDVKKHNTNF